MTRKEMKALARLQIEGKIGALFLLTFLSNLIISAVAYLPVAGMILSFIFSAAFTLAFIYVYFRIAADPSYKPRVRDLFSNINDFWPMLKVILLSSLFTFFWSLLFIVPGIIKAISYSQAPYIIAENPNMPAMEALRQSERMMMGRKWEYFVLSLSFLGWALLAIPTLGLITIWLEPYMQMTMVNFYSDLKSSNNWFNPWGAPPPPFEENYM